MISSLSDKPICYQSAKESGMADVDIDILVDHILAKDILKKKSSVKKLKPGEIHDAFEGWLKYIFESFKSFNIGRVSSRSIEMSITTRLRTYRCYTFDPHTLKAGSPSIYSLADSVDQQLLDVIATPCLGIMHKNDIWIVKPPDMDSTEALAKQNRWAKLYDQCVDIKYRQYRN